MTDSKLSALVVGFGAAGVVFAGLFYVVGVNAILTALGAADLSLVAVVAALMLGWVGVQGVALWMVWRSLGVRTPVWKAVLVFAGAAFANNMTPFGQAGGEPVAALLTTDVSDAEYETAFAAIASADALNFVPSTTLALVAAAAYAVSSTVTSRMQSLAVAVVVFGATIALVGGAVWRWRDHVQRTMVRLLTPVLRRLAAVVPRVSVPTPDRVATGIDQFFRSIERVAADRPRLVAALVCSTLGLVLQATAMWLTFQALGHPIPPYVPFFVIPVGTMAAIGPTPGGLGSIESVHVALLTSLTAVAPPVVTAAVVIHSIGGFWLTMTSGGASFAIVRTGLE